MHRIDNQYDMRNTLLFIPKGIEFESYSQQNIGRNIAEQVVVYT